LHLHLDPPVGRPILAEGSPRILEHLSDTEDLIYRPKQAHLSLCALSSVLLIAERYRLSDSGRHYLNANEDVLRLHGLSADDA